jgi:hypothetical protein
VQLKSITGYRKLDNIMFQNYINFFTQYYKQKQDQTSQEFQVIGKAFNKRVDCWDFSITTRAGKDSGNPILV